jgi:hypothetical protein
VEILNGIENLLKEKRFDQAISDLNYLLRTAPTRDQEIRYKLARIYLSRNDPTQALISLSPLLPSSNKDITELAIQSLISQDQLQNSFLILLNSPLSNCEKQELFRLYFLDTNEDQNTPPIVAQIDIHCSYCGEYLFFYQRQSYCLKCCPSILAKFLA